MNAKVNRRTVDLSAYPDLVVIYLGMRVNALTGLKTLAGFGPRIAKSVDARPDGLLLRETVVEYWQVARIFGAEVKAILGCERPEGMTSRQSITAYGGGTLIFDQYGRVKYHISHPLFDRERQGARLEFLWRTGYFERSQQVRSRFSAIHRSRAVS